MKKLLLKLANWLGLTNSKEKTIDELLKESVKNSKLNVKTNPSVVRPNIKSKPKPKDYNFKQNLNPKFNNPQTVYRNSLGRFASRN